MSQEVAPKTAMREIKTPDVIKKIRGTVSIKPYVSDMPNMGHEKYDEVLFPGTEQMDIVMCVVRDNVKTYTTGLNEFSADVQGIAEQAKKMARVKDIRETVAFLENTANANFKVSPSDCMANYGRINDRGESMDDFWENVTMFQSVCVDKYDAKGNRILTYWDRLSVILTNEGRALNLKDAHDLAIYHVIMANGFGLIANSLEKAVSEGGYNFYLHKAEDVYALKTSFKKDMGQAFGYLTTMLTGDPNKMFYMAKVLAPVGSTQYKMGGESATPIDQMYEDLWNYLEGKSLEKDKKIAVPNFLEKYKLDMAELAIRAIVKDATEMNLITVKGSGQLYCIKNNAVLGKNIEEVVAHLQNPIHEDTLTILKTEVEKNWRN